MSRNLPQDTDSVWARAMQETRPVHITEPTEPPAPVNDQDTEDQR